MDNQVWALKAENVSYRYPGNDFDSVKELTLSIEQGSCTGLIGPNGAGKSTIISLLTGLLQPSEGQVRYQSQPPNQPLLEYIKQSVALVPQEYAFYSELTVRQNLQYFARLTRNYAQHVLTDTLSVCQLDEFAEQKVSTLSGGYKRRLNIAIALLKEPGVIFLDEPTVGIDPVSRQLIISLLKELKNKGTTIIYTSHLLSEVQQVCDHVFGVKNGQAFTIDATSANPPLQITWSFPLSQANLTLLNEQLPTVKLLAANKIEIYDFEQPLSVLSILEKVHNNPVIEINYAKHNLDKYYLELFLPQ